MSASPNRGDTNGTRYPQWLRRLLPFLDWIHELRDGKTLRADLVAGVTVALVLVPQSMAYAQLAGLPAYYGLYTAFLPPIVAALFGSSRQLATGPVAVVSLLTAAALEPIAASGSAGYIAYAIALSLLVGLFQLALGLLRLGVMVNFLSHPVILGFTNAAAIIIATSQLGKVFGVRADKAAHHYETVWNTIVAVARDMHWPTFAMALAAFAVMLALKRVAPHAPNVLIAVTLSGVVSWLIGFEAMGNGAVVGTIPQGLPSLALPGFDFEVVRQLLSAATTIALIGFIEAISIAKAMAARTRHRLDANQELIGQGLANVVGSLSQSYPTSGSFSRSAVNLGAGAVTGLSSVVTGALVVATLLWLTPLLYHVPQATLAAVIMLAVIGLINVNGIAHAWRANRQDGVVAVASFALTLAFAPHIDHGILVGAALALVLYLYRTMRPRVAMVARHADGTLRDARRSALRLAAKLP